MLKVCSYKRSGTHYLMALLASNFKFSEDLECKADTRQQNKWITTGETTASVPWGKLFLTHDRYGSVLEGEMIYIYRNPINVMRSMWEFQGKPGGLNEFVTERMVEEWRNHVDGYINAGVYPVKYEHLCAMPFGTIVDIKKAFDLKLKDGQFHPVTERVGWKEKAKMAETEGYSTAALDIFRDVLGAEYRGYRL